MKGLLVALSMLLSSVQAHALNRFAMRLTTDPTGFDWNVASTTMDTYVLLNIMEGLVSYDGNMNVVPGLAKSWDVSADGKTYTFHLRRDVKWSDGESLVAQHFVDSWLRLLNPATAASYAYLLHDVEGAESYNTGRTKNAALVGIKAPDRYTFQVQLARPVAHFIHMPTFWVTFPIRDDLIKSYGKEWTSPGKLVVLGAYNIDSYQPGHELVLKRNLNYYGSKPQVENVVMRIVAENSTAINLYRSKQLDFVNQIDLTELGSLTTTPDFHTATYHRLYFISFNVKSPPFDSVELRQALSMAVDRSKLTRLFQGAKKPAFTIVPTDLLKLPGGESGAPIIFDPKAAKELMRKAGVRDPAGLYVTLLADSSEENSMVTQFIQQELKQNLGIHVEIQMSEFRTFRSHLDALEGQMFLRRWGADYPDPDTFMSMFISTSGNNKTGWVNPEYDSIIKETRATKPGAARDKLFLNAQSLLLKKDCPVTPLYFDSMLYLLNPKVNHFKINSLNYIFLKDITI